MPTTSSPRSAQITRHTALVRITHWLTVLCFLTLLVTGAEIVVSHPRFYWGEAGNVNMHPLFAIPIPSSRGTVPTGYGYVMPDQNGWSRYLHFETAWLLVFTAAIYGFSGFITRHFQHNLIPAPNDRNPLALWRRITQYLRRSPADPAEELAYNVLQRTAYLIVIFVLFPLVIWTGLALSPSFDSAFPFAVNLLGGRQSARTLHFFVSAAILLFFFVHVVMIALSGFKSRMRAMITGRLNASRTILPENHS